MADIRTFAALERWENGLWPRQRWSRERGPYHEVLQRLWADYQMWREHQERRGWYGWMRMLHKSSARNRLGLT